MAIELNDSHIHEGLPIIKKVSRRKFLEAAGMTGLGLIAAGCDVLFPTPEAPTEAPPTEEPSTPTAGPVPTAALGRFWEMPEVYSLAE